MYDSPGTDTGREWIEVYNETADPIQLSDWKLFESNSNHGISVSRGDGVLSPNEYAVVASSGITSLTEYPTYTGDVYDSSFSLNNAGESFSFKTPTGSFVANVTYVGGVLAVGDGNSLHWISGQWVSRTPNPGNDPNSATGGGQSTNNQNTTGGSNTSSGTNQNNPSTNNTDRTTPVVPVYTMTVTTDPGQPVARAPFVVTPKIIRRLGEESSQYTHGIVRIVTGDGRQIVRSKTDPIEITYARAGRYKLLIEYSQSNIPNEPLAQYSTDIDVIEPTIVISREGNMVTLTNESDEEIDISLYRIRSESGEFVIAEGTAILPRSTISIGGSEKILKGRPRIIELVSSDSKTKISAREFVASNTNKIVPLSERVRPLPVVDKKIVTQSTAVKKTIDSQYHGDLYSLVRDRSLVDYSNIPLLEDTITPSYNATTALATEPNVEAIITSEEQTEDSRSENIAIAVYIALFCALITSLNYWYLDHANKPATSNMLSAESNREVFDSENLEDYIITERKQ